MRLLFPLALAQGQQLLVTFLTGQDGHAVSVLSDDVGDAIYRVSYSGS